MTELNNGKSLNLFRVLISSIRIRMPCCLDYLIMTLHVKPSDSEKEADAQGRRSGHFSSNSRT